MAYQPDDPGYVNPNDQGRLDDLAPGWFGYGNDRWDNQNPWNTDPEYGGGMFAPEIIGVHFDEEGTHNPRPGFYWLNRRDSDGNLRRFEVPTFIRDYIGDAPDNAEDFGPWVTTTIQDHNLENGIDPIYLNGRDPAEARAELEAAVAARDSNNLQQDPGNTDSPYDDWGIPGPYQPPWDVTFENGNRDNGGGWVFDIPPIFGPGGIFDTGGNDDDDTNTNEGEVSTQPLPPGPVYDEEGRGSDVSDDTDSGFDWGPVIDGAVSLGLGWLEDRDNDNARREARPQPYNYVDPHYGATGWQGQNILFQGSPMPTQLGLGGQQFALDRLNNPNLRASSDNAYGLFSPEQQSQIMRGATNTTSFNPLRSTFSVGNRMLQGAGANMLSSLNPNLERGSAINMAADTYGKGNQLFGRNYEHIAQDRYNMLRQMAVPEINKARNATNQRLFSSGNYGSKAGAMDRAALEDSIFRADLGRAVEGQNLATDLYKTDQANARGLFDLSRGFLSTGAGAAAGLAGVGANMLGTMNTINSDRARIGSDLIGLENTRAQGRFQTLQDIFGFGANVDQNQFASIGSGLGLSNNVSENNRANISLAANPFGYGANPFAGLGQYADRNNALSNFIGFLGGRYGSDDGSGETG